MDGLKNAILECIDIEKQGLKCLELTDKLIKCSGIPIPIFEEVLTGNRIDKIGHTLLKLQVDKGTISIRPAGWTEPLTIGDCLNFDGPGFPIYSIACPFIVKSDVSATVTGTFSFLPVDDLRLICECDENGIGHFVEFLQRRFLLSGLNDPGFSHNTLIEIKGLDAFEQ